MTQDEWYESDEFKTMRLLNNLTHGIKQTTQQLYDLLQLVMSQNEGIGCHDKFTIYERQLRIVDAEAANLIRTCSGLESLVRPKKEEEK